MFNSYRQTTLKYDPEECINCGMCTKVCPHAVFERREKAVALVNPEACMECGACFLNCPTEAIEVESGVGCAAAMIQAALTGGEETCGDDCCGGTGGEEKKAEIKVR
jgi:NAD-dependent dihydropyrimidine dehydrogenase PreA subunit